MSKTIIKSFQVNRDQWENFEEMCKAYNSTPAEMLREFVKHIDTAVEGIRTGVVKTFDGDISRLIRTEFPQLTPFQLQLMSDILAEAARQGDKQAKEGTD
jgi:hypothetical protein